MKTKCNIFPKLFVRHRLFLILLGFVVLLSSCATVQVGQDYDTNYTFGDEKTFGWNKKLPHENSDLLRDDELLAKRFREAIEEVLTNRGFRQVAHPAFLISYSYTINSILQTDPFDSRFGFGYGYGRYGYHHTVGIDAGNTIRQYDQGKLIIYIHSAQTGHLVWKGTGTQEVFTLSDPDQITHSVYEMVEAVLAQFPPLKKG
jgi:hypothetical protein